MLQPPNKIAVILSGAKNPRISLVATIRFPSLRKIAISGNRELLYDL